MNAKNSTSEYAAKISHTGCQLVMPLVVYISTTLPLTTPPRIQPKPLVIIRNIPCALARISGLTSFSTNTEPEMLKKSKAQP